MYAKSYARRTQINFGGVQHRNALIEQSLNYSITFSRKFNSFVMKCVYYLPIGVSTHTMKCIGLLTWPNSSTCSHYTWQNLIQVLLRHLKMPSNSCIIQISTCSYFCAITGKI